MTGLRLIHEAWDATEAEAGEVFKLIICLQDIADLPDSLTVLVFIVEGVEGGRIRSLPI